MPLPPPPKIKMPTMPTTAKPSPPSNTHIAKTFAVQTWEAGTEGKKIILYGANGMGKSTLAAMAPGAVFLGADDGARNILHPKTGARVRHIPGVETFQDLRDVIGQTSLFQPGETLVFDTITEYDQWGIRYTCGTVKTDSGKTADSLEDYGYGKGYAHQNDTMRLLLPACDTLIRKGVNILMLAQQGQATVSNLEGKDYMQDGPLLTAQPKAGGNVRATFCSWADHIFRIGYAPVDVQTANVKAAKGKATGSTERMIYTEPEVYFIAKNRMNGTLPAVVSFASREDDSIWTYVFGEQK